MEGGGGEYKLEKRGLNGMGNRINENKNKN